MATVPLSQRINNDLKYPSLYVHTILALLLGVVASMGAGLIYAALRPPELNEATGTYSTALLSPFPYLTRLDFTSWTGILAGTGIGVVMLAIGIAGIAYILRKGWGALPAEWDSTLDQDTRDATVQVTRTYIEGWERWLAAAAAAGIVTLYCIAVFTNWQEGGVELGSYFYWKIFIWMVAAACVYQWSARRSSRRPELLSSAYWLSALVLGVILFADARLFSYFVASLAQAAARSWIIWSVAGLGGLLAAFGTILAPRLSFLVSLHLVSAPAQSRAEAAKKKPERPRGELAVITHEQRVVREQIENQLHRMPTVLKTALDPALWAQLHPLGATGAAAIVGFLIPQVGSITHLGGRDTESAKAIAKEQAKKLEAREKGPPTNTVLDSFVSMALGSVVHEVVSAMKSSFIESFNRKAQEAREREHIEPEEPTPQVH